MANNKNGKNVITIDIPCCDGDELQIVYKTDKNKMPFSAFKLIADRIGVLNSVTSILSNSSGVESEDGDDEISVMKGAGG